MREGQSQGYRHRPWRWIGLGTGAAALLIALAGAGYWYVITQARVSEYRARAELLAWTFQDRVSFDLARGNEQDLEFLTGTLVLGNILYAQIVVDGQVLAEVNQLNEPLSIPTSEAGDEVEGEVEGEVLTIERRVTAQGQAYWDIRRALPDRQGYVRLGLSLEPLERELRAQLWLTLGVGTGAVALVGLILTALLSRPQPAQEAPTAEPRAEATSPATASTPWKRIGDLAIDVEGKRVAVRGCPVELSPKEFELLALLASEPGRVFSNQEILEHVWPNSHYASAQDVKQYIYFLRQKLERNPRSPELIVTVRGFGYKLQG